MSKRPQTRNYASLLALAVKHRNRKRGKKDILDRYVRLNPDDETQVLVGGWERGTHGATAEQGGDAYGHRNLDEEDQPWVTEVLLAHDHAIFYPNDAYLARPPVLPPAVLAKYPGYVPLKYKPARWVSIGLNNLIQKCNLPVRHDGCKDKHPGFLWRVMSYDSRRYWERNDDITQAKIYGPVRYNYGSQELLPVLPQPQREVKDELRRELNTTLRAAFKRLRILSRMGVEVPVEAFSARLSNEAEARNHYEKADALVDALVALDFEDPEAIHDVTVRIACVLQPQHMWQRSRAPATSWECDRLRARVGDTGLIHAESDLVALRKRIHAHYEIVNYTRA